MTASLTTITSHLNWITTIVCGLSLRLGLDPPGMFKASLITSLKGLCLSMMAISLVGPPSSVYQTSSEPILLFIRIPSVWKEHMILTAIHGHPQPQEQQFSTLQRQEHHGDLEQLTHGM